jgi:amidase
MIRRILAAAAVSASALGAQARPQFNVVEATIDGVHAAFKAKTLTCRALVQAYLDRIEAYDKKGPALNSIVVVNTRALAIADSLDRRYTRGGLVGPLHCVPTIVKDNFETNDLQTTGGSGALAGWIPKRDAYQVRKIKEAGAIVLAKSNMAEWAFSPLETVNSILGWSHNPYDTSRVTAGSSGGTAAAVAASLGLVGLGSDTGNSIRGPSSHQALFGIRSQMGLTSRAGVIPLNNRADIAGPMARTVSDAVKVFDVIAGTDPEDAVTAQADAKREKDYNAFVKTGALRGARIGVLRQAYERASTDSEVVRVFNAAVAELRAAGATIIDTAGVDSLQALTRGQGGGCNPFKFDVERYFAARGEGAPVKTLKEVIATGKYHSSIAGRLIGADSVTTAPENLPGCTYREEVVKLRVRAAVTKMMDSLNLDALVYPTWSNPPRVIGDNQAPTGDNSQLFSPTTGFPAMTVPIGYTRGNTLPLGMTFFGRAWSEGKLISLSYDYEQKYNHRRAPALTPPLTR